MSLGVIPSIKTPSYGELRNREEGTWYSAKMRDFLNERLYDDNLEYGSMRALFVNAKYFAVHFFRRFVSRARLLAWQGKNLLKDEMNSPIGS